MNINKIIIFLFGLTLITGQASAIRMEIIPSSGTIYPGQTFDMNVFIDPQGSEIAGGQLNFAFDSSLIRVNDVTEGNLFSQKGAGTYFNEGTINNSLGSVLNVFGLILGRYNVSNPGVFITISATAVGPTGSTQITLSNVKFNGPEDNTIPVEVINRIMTIRLKGDLNNNGIPADAGDQVLMRRASIGEIEADSSYDLNDNGLFADAGDQVLMKRASIGEITI